MAEADDFIVPVYLNQRMVFDLVAVLEGGIASVTQVSHTQTQTAGETRQIGTSFGVGQALSSLLRVDLSGKRDRQSSDDTSNTTTQERVHTPASLFILLRSALRDNRYLKLIEEKTQIAPGDLVEFSTVLKRNPLLETLELVLELDKISKAFADKPQKGRQQAQSGMQNRKQIEFLINSFKTGDTLDLATPPLPSSHRAVVSLETQSLNDPSMSDLVDGTFRVVGKVTRCISESDGAISLNRKSALNRLPPALLEQFKTIFQSAELAEFDLPDPDWEIPGPAIQVLPIAIFA